MSAQILSTEDVLDSEAELGAPRPDAPQALRILAMAAVCLGVAALAAATFVLSYSAIRAVVLQAGITPRLARGYPLLLDAMLVIVLAAILALRSAGLPSRLLAWITLLLVMTVAAGADALHTARRSIPHQAAAITAAVMPFVLVLVAFVLLLVMLRHARLRRLAAADQASVYRSGWGAAERTPATGGFEPGLGAPTLADAQPELVVDADPGGTDEAVTEPATGTTPYPVDALATGWPDDDDATEHQFGGLAPAADPDDDGPVFYRLFSAPTPPDIEMTEVQAAEADPAESETSEA